MAVRPLVVMVRRFPSGRFVVANRSPVIVVTRATAATAIATVVEAIIAVAVCAIAFVVIFVSVVVVVVAATRVFTAGAQSTAYEREQLLYVPVELIRKTRNAGTVRRRRGAVS